MNISIDERARVVAAGRADRARALAARLLYTTAPVSRRRTATARWIGRFCATLLIVAGCYSAATGTWQGDLVAAYALATGVWCWRHQHAMKPR